MHLPVHGCRPFFPGLPTNVRQLRSCRSEEAAVAHPEGLLVLVQPCPWDSQPRCLTCRRPAADDQDCPKDMHTAAYVDMLFFGESDMDVVFSLCRVHLQRSIWQAVTHAHSCNLVRLCEDWPTCCCTNAAPQAHLVQLLHQAKFCSDHNTKTHPGENNIYRL